APELSTVVPQANDFGKVLALPGLIASGCDDSAKVAAHFGFTPRQSSYYREAAEALGLIDRGYRLTDAGRRYLSCNDTVERTELVLQLSLRLPIIHEVMRVVLDEGEVRRMRIDRLLREHG